MTLQYTNDVIPDVIVQHIIFWVNLCVIRIRNTEMGFRLRLARLVWVYYGEVEARGFRGQNIPSVTQALDTGQMLNHSTNLSTIAFYWPDEFDYTLPIALLSCMNIRNICSHTTRANLQAFWRFMIVHARTSAMHFLIPLVIAGKHSNSTLIGSTTSFNQSILCWLLELKFRCVDVDFKSFTSIV